MPTLDIVEIRTLDGANIFLLEPAIKVQARVGALAAGPLATARDRLGALLAPLGVPPVTGDEAAGEDVARGLLWPATRVLHAALDLPVPARAITGRALAAGKGWEFVVAYGWSWRGCAEEIAEAAVGLAWAALDGTPFAVAATLDALRQALATDRAAGDGPLLVRDAARHIPVVGITGTNGKTTTTRCLAHILASAGWRVGMASSAGVWLRGERVLEGDYTGPQGARRVLEDEGELDVAVLETARGGILLRGIAYESDDVGVITNVSADHLGLQGIDTVAGLAEVKSLVVRLTRPDGLAVLNADDLLVAPLAAATRAPVLFFSSQPENPVVRDHLAAGGRALLADGEMIVVAEGSSRATLAALADVPITFGGQAAHMVENALAAAGAALGLGLSPAEVAAGLASFRNSPEQNVGRLNVFAIRQPDCTFVVDYAHNEAGLAQLLRFGRGLAGPDGRLLAIIGTAGDRSDDALRAIGRLAGGEADRVWIRETEHYLRGRPRESMNALFAAGIAEGQGRAEGDYAIVPDELAAVDAALAAARPGDAIVLMCFEQQAAVLARLATLGVPVAG